ncbi:type I-E CRISPR-associated endoribonuclease Cas2 [Streptomyces pseudogriseolus]|uniref:type I-E CRISPR-associated endoribonuclease Cas2 n=1 Tax=Streptomyces pseudogriseolus TaxID=36817 RepID=UPI003FA22968
MHGPPLGPQNRSPPCRRQLRHRRSLMPSMVVIATTAVPDHLRGAFSRWTSEVVPGIFVRLRPRPRRNSGKPSPKS